MTSDISTCHLTPGRDLREWVDAIEALYNDLCDLDSEAMSDCVFVLNLLGNISSSNEWQDFGSHLRDRLGKYDNHEPVAIPVTPVEFVVRIREEHWFRSKSKAQTTAADTFSFSARTTEDRGSPKCSWASDSTTLTPTSAKRSRPSDEKTCSNPNCSGKKGHTLQECMAFGGGNQGKYAADALSPRYTRARD